MENNSFSVKNLMKENHSKEIKKNLHKSLNKAKNKVVTNTPSYETKSTQYIHKKIHKEEISNPKNQRESKVIDEEESYLKSENSSIPTHRNKSKKTHQEFSSLENSAKKIDSPSILKVSEKKQNYGNLQKAGGGKKLKKKNHAL